MHPILIRIPLPGGLGPLPIYSYGVMLGLSLVVGWYLTLGLAERDGLPKETMANNYVVTAVAAVLGARILYILTNLNEFDSIGSMFAMRRGGLVAYGGFLGGFVGSLVYLRMHRIALLPWADVAVPSLASGLMITRIGCYLFGCDFGQPLSETAPAWLKKLGTFPHWPEGTLEHGSGAPAWVQHVKERGLAVTSEHSLPVHPTQLYESLVGAALLVILLVARKHQKFRGQIFLLFTFSYGVCRYMLEVLRDDAERGSIPPALPEHLLIPFGLLVFAIAYTVGFSKAIKSGAVRVATQVLSFAPAVVLFLAMRPETFASTATMQYSTSQAVAVITGFAAAIAFAVYYKAALAHPEAAMALNLPGASGAAGKPIADEDEDEDEPPPEKKPAKAAKPAGKKAAAKSKERADDEDDQGEEAGGADDEDEPSAKRAAPSKGKRAKADEEEGDEGEEKKASDEDDAGEAKEA
ncbi:MAG: prolipoprotein diacylglyceryl transferase [Polyangiaceae bacterium]|nr:prolipoprotein diacylglyceryl transferase [Polyangiaceae bacterium]